MCDLCRKLAERSRERRMACVLSGGERTPGDVCPGCQEAVAAFVELMAEHPECLDVFLDVDEVSAHG